MRRAYGRLTTGERTRALPAWVPAVAASGAAAYGAPGLGVGVAAGAVAGWSRARRVGGGGAAVVVLVGLALVVGLVATWRAGDARAALAPDRLGPVSGWITVVDDPQTYPSATRVIVEVDGERFEVWARGRAFRGRLAGWRGGERHLVVGELHQLDDERAGRVAWQHVVGELRIEHVADRTVGAPLDRASNRVRIAIERGAATLGHPDGALFRGLVIGDDRDQPRAMIERFRASGLSHLTAVSGQNVAFVLAGAAPVLRRLRPGWRWACTLGLIGWFVSLTRFEPSIVRAGTMATLAATAMLLGRRADPVRLLSLAVTALVLIDPLIVGSVGFWLSVGATFGVAALGPPIAARVGGPRWLALPFGVTLGAQIGVVAPAVLVFGRLPLVSIPANLLAVPVAGAVMLYGLPAGLLAGAVADAAPWLAAIVLFPCRVGVRWVDTVAALGERVEPGGVATWVGWVLVVVAVAVFAAMHRGRDGNPTADR